MWARRPERTWTRLGRTRYLGRTRCHNVLGLGASSGLELNSSDGLGLDASLVGLGVGASSGLELNPSGGLGLDASSGSLANLEGNTGRYDLRNKPKTVAHRIRVEEEPMDSSDPLSYREAIAHPRFGQKWSDAVDEELRSLGENSTWDSVGLEDVPASVTSVSSKWVFKTKELPGGGIRNAAKPTHDASPRCRLRLGNRTNGCCHRLPESQS